MIPYNITYSKIYKHKQWWEKERKAAWRNHENTRKTERKKWWWLKNESTSPTWANFNHWLTDWLTVPLPFFFLLLFFPFHSNFRLAFWIFPLYAFIILFTSLYLHLFVSSLTKLSFSIIHNSRFQPLLLFTYLFIYFLLRGRIIKSIPFPSMIIHIFQSHTHTYPFFICCGVTGVSCFVVLSDEWDREGIHVNKHGIRIRAKCTLGKLSGWWKNCTAALFHVILNH